MLTRVPILLHRLYSFAPFSCWILICDVNFQALVGYCPTSWTPLFLPSAHPGLFTQQDAVGKRRVGMWIWEAGHGFVSFSLCRQLGWATMACCLLSRALPEEKNISFMHMVKQIVQTYPLFLHGSVQSHVRQTEVFWGTVWFFCLAFGMLKWIFLCLCFWIPVVLTLTSKSFLPSGTPSKKLVSCTLVCGAMQRWFVMWHKYLKPSIPSGHFWFWSLPFNTAHVLRRRWDAPRSSAGDTKNKLNLK